MTLRSYLTPTDGVGVRSESGDQPLQVYASQAVNDLYLELEFTTKSTDALVVGFPDPMRARAMHCPHHSLFRFLLGSSFAVLSTLSPSYHCSCTLYSRAMIHSSPPSVCLSSSPRLLLIRVAHSNSSAAFSTLVQRFRVITLITHHGGLGCNQSEARQAR